MNKRKFTAVLGAFLVFVIGFLTFYSGKVDADLFGWLFNNDDIYYSGGDVGIGTENPEYKLDVNDRIIRVSGNTPAILLDESVNGGRQWALYSGSPGLGFKIRDNGVGQDRFVIDEEGKLGIRTSTPDYAVDVDGGALRLKGSTPRLILKDKDYNGIAWVLEGGNPSQTFRVKNNSTNETKFFIDKDGGVCIGNC